MALLDFPLNNIIKIRSIKLRIRWYGEENERRATGRRNTKISSSKISSSPLFDFKPPLPPSKENMNNFHSKR
jgi:hypothetical protein